MGETYFVLYQSEDGAGMLGPLTRGQLLDYINDPENAGTLFLDRVPDYDGWCWMTQSHNAALIIKGSIVVPRSVEVVTRLEV